MITIPTHLKRDFKFLDMKTKGNRIATSCREDNDDAMQEHAWSVCKAGEDLWMVIGGP